MQASIYQDVIGIQAAGQAYSLGSRFQECSQHRAVRLETIFELLILKFREDLLQALAEEPPGPARHLRAYIRCVCDMPCPPARPEDGRTVADPRKIPEHMV